MTCYYGGQTGDYNSYWGYTDCVRGGHAPGSSEGGGQQEATDTQEHPDQAVPGVHGAQFVLECLWPPAVLHPLNCLAHGLTAHGVSVAPVGVVVSFCPPPSELPGAWP